MIENLWQEVSERIENGEINDLKIRQNLSQMRKEIKEMGIEQISDNLFEEVGKVFATLLKSEDAKIRKNSALLAAELEMQEFLDPLCAAYENEAQRFVKTAYLEALSKLDYREYLPTLREKMKALSQEEVTIENKKHLEEEMRMLSDMLISIEGIKPHKFVGYHELSEIILLTNRDHTEATKRQIEFAEVETFNAGIKTTTNQLNKIQPIRTYHELLFVIEGMKILPTDAKTAAMQIANSMLVDFLKRRHKGDSPFYFRLEVKSKMTPEKKSVFVRELSTGIERETKRALINSKSNYEIEIRLIENKEGDFNTLLKLQTIKDERFWYRVEVSPESIKPVNAALLVELAKEYMKDDARILDPFCGVGTLLIERQQVVKGNTSYGIDILGDVVEKAKKNTEAAGQIIHYINKDFFEFTHEYLFDEIFTEMPFVIGRKTKEEVLEIYQKFFKKAKKHLDVDGTIIMHSCNAELVKQLAPKAGYRIIKKWELNKKKGMFLFVLK